MNNNDFNELMKKAQSMINNNQVPPEIAAMMKNLNSQKNNNNMNSINNLMNNTNLESSNNNDINSNNSNNVTDDNISNLLEALRPYMRDAKKEKIDEYIKLVKMGKAAKLFNMLNNNNRI